MRIGKPAIVQNILHVELRAGVAVTFLGMNGTIYFELNYCSVVGVESDEPGHSGGVLKTLRQTSHQLSVLCKDCVKRRPWVIRCGKNNDVVVIVSRVVALVVPITIVVGGGLKG